MVESSDKMWSTGEGNGKPLQSSCLENPMSSMMSLQRPLLTKLHIRGWQEMLTGLYFSIRSWAIKGGFTVERQ